MLPSKNQNLDNAVFLRGELLVRKKSIEKDAGNKDIKSYVQYIS